MMRPVAPIGDPALVAHYELLRGEALGVDGSRGHGLVLFLRRGMAAWMSAWPGEEGRAHRPAATRPETREGEVSGAIQREAVGLLVCMALAQRGERTA
jgi:hypothetical protein